MASAVPAGLLEGSAAAARLAARRPPRQERVGRRCPGTVAIDPRACVGDPAFDLIDWVLVEGGDERTAMPRAERLADLTGVDPAKSWRWCESTAVLVAISKFVQRDSPTEATRSLLTLARNAAYRRSPEG